MKAQNSLLATCVWRRVLRAIFGRTAWAVLGLVAVLAFSPALLGADAFIKSPPHTFTDTNGRAIEASIVQVQEPYVYLSINGGDAFKVQIAVFDFFTQTYIRQWAKEQAAVVQANSVLEISGTDNHLLGGFRSSGPQSFNVIVKNTSGKPLSNLTAQYILFRLPGAGGKPVGSQLFRVTGASPIGNLGPKQGTAFDSDSLTNGNAPIAIWVRVYNGQGALVAEWLSDPSLAKTEKWESTP